jgi:hypothetical protein
VHDRSNELINIFTKRKSTPFYALTETKRSQLLRIFGYKFLTGFAELDKLATHLFISESEGHDFSECEFASQSRSQP